MTLCTPHALIVESLAAATTEQSAHGGACADARQLRKRASEREGELQWRIPARFDLRALPAHRVFDGTTRDRATAVTSDLDDETRNDRRFFAQCAGCGLHELGLVVVVVASHRPSLA